MHDKILTITKSDPLHEGHVKLFKIGLELAKEQDVYLAERMGPSKLFLPYEVRRKTLEALAESEHFKDGLTIRDKHPYLWNLPFHEYSGILMGSDLANRTYCDETPGYMHRLYKNFERFFIIQRKGYELTADVRDHMHKLEVIELDHISNLSGTKIRELIRLGRDVSHLIPEVAYPLIESHFELIRNNQSNHI